MTVMRDRRGGQPVRLHHNLTKPLCNSNAFSDALFYGLHLTSYDVAPLLLLRWQRTVLRARLDGSRIGFVLTVVSAACSFLWRRRFEVEVNDIWINIKYSNVVNSGALCAGSSRRDKHEAAKRTRNSGRSVRSHVHGAPEVFNRESGGRNCRVRKQAWHVHRPDLRGLRKERP